MPATVLRWWDDRDDSAHEVAVKPCDSGLIIVVTEGLEEAGVIIPRDLVGDFVAAVTGGA